MICPSKLPLMMPLMICPSLHILLLQPAATLTRRSPNNECDFVQVPKVAQSFLLTIAARPQEAAIRMALDACLASDEEVALAAEGQLRDELFGGDEEEGSD